MYKIRYYYSSLSKQVFLIIAALALAIRFALFFLGGFYKQAYTAATVLLYLIAFGLCIFFFIAWKLFYYEFDESFITKYDRITKKKAGLDLAPIRRALFSKSGISLFYEDDKEPRFHIPFHKFGVVSPVGVENFMNLMKNHGVQVEQEYDALPGYGPSAKWFARLFILLSVVLIINSFQYGVLVFLILAAG